MSKRTAPSSDGRKRRLPLWRLIGILLSALGFLAFFAPVSDKEIPPTSLLREFVGGSSFKY